MLTGSEVNEEYRAGVVDSTKVTDLSQPLNCPPFDGTPAFEQEDFNRAALGNQPEIEPVLTNP